MRRWRRRNRRSAVSFTSNARSTKVHLTRARLQTTRAVVVLTVTITEIRKVSTMSMPNGASTTTRIGTDGERDNISQTRMSASRSMARRHRVRSSSRVNNNFALMMVPGLICTKPSRSCCYIKNSHVIHWFFWHFGRVMYRLQLHRLGGLNLGKCWMVGIALCASSLETTNNIYFQRNMVHILHFCKFFVAQCNKPCFVL